MARQGRGRYPDFIIAGAMKSGTTSLHRILASDPRIYVPAREIFFFDMDDLLEHPDFAFRDGDRWLTQRYSPSDAHTVEWYSSFFAAATEGQWIGEDSTTYLASAKAGERIASFLPEAKVIVLLRDPAGRTYSHYWHLLRTGRATLSFEDTLRLAPGTLLQRSLYKPQVERFRGVFGRERLLILLFEEFVADMEAHVRHVYELLGIPDPSRAATASSHANPALVPRWPGAQLWWNLVHRRFLAGARYSRHLPNASAAPQGPRLIRLADRVFRTINPALPRRPPPMRPATRRMLNEYFAVQNEGLDKLVDKDLAQYWYRVEG
jgi:hypothetical protein